MPTRTNRRRGRRPRKTSAYKGKGRSRKGYSKSGKGLFKRNQRKEIRRICRDSTETKTIYSMSSHMDLNPSWSYPVVDEIGLKLSRGDQDTQFQGDLLTPKYMNLRWALCPGNYSYVSPMGYSELVNVWIIRMKANQTDYGTFMLREAWPTTTYGGSDETRHEYPMRTFIKTNPHFEILYATGWKQLVRPHSQSLQIMNAVDDTTPTSNIYANADRKTIYGKYTIRFPNKQIRMDEGAENEEVTPVSSQYKKMYIMFLSNVADTVVPGTGAQPDVSWKADFYFKA